MSSLSAMDKQLLIAKINDGSFVLDDLSIDRCPKLETGDISRDVLKQVYARMVEEKVKKHLKTALELQSQTGYPSCIPAPHLVSVIVLLTIRRVRINTDRFAEDSQPFARLFGHCRMSQWLPIAIKFYEQIHNGPFILKTVKGITEPMLTQLFQDDKMVSIIYTSGPSLPRLRALPALIVERIKGLSTPTDLDVMMGGNDDASINANSPGEDEPISVILTTTRVEALQSGAEVLGKLGLPGVDQASLRLGLDMWLSEPHIRVMPRHVKNDLFYWCSDYLPHWIDMIRSCLDEDRETWVIETEVPANPNLNIPEGGGSDFLRLYGQLANKASLLTSSNPVEARRLMGRVENGIRLFAAKAYMRDLQAKWERGDLDEFERFCFELANTTG
ncbi:hypothetical protein FMEXI_5481 [Fusarium mexicanum]|uniref:Uncharacterized protein n=1 Tax=Fusarium mexicanum TaxID=751941 RepID=A0A8H5N090_9HYPO|nr:hypothetical protein FMEXI_5481 [Fusarium mexicanum]